MKNLNSNLIVQFVSLVLWVFALAGLQINPEQTASDSYTALVTANWPLFTIIFVNIAGSVYKWVQTWKTNRPNFLLFLRSPYWWASFLNIIFAWMATKGIVVSADAAQRIVELAFSGDWWQLAGYILPSVIAPIVYFLTNNLNKKIKEKAGLPTN